MEQLASNTNKTFSRKKYYLIYSGIFLFCIGSYILFLVLNGKTNINATSDGMNQGYRVLFYYSRYLKEIFRNLIYNHKLIIPLYDFSIGEGSDIISSLHADAFGDPIMFLSVLVPEKYLWIFYFFNVSLKQYLAGVFFSELCFYLKKDNIYAILAGTIVYTFCFWSLRFFTLHIHFLSPLMFMPLLILGVEKIFNDEKPYVFILAVFFASTCWFYFFYAEAIIIAIYGIIRAIFKYKNDYKLIILKLLKTFAFALIGLMMAAIIISPIVITYLHDTRFGLAHPVSLLYSRFFYERLYTVFVGNDYPYDLHMGYASCTLLALAILIKNPKKYKFLLLLDVLCMIFVCLPICGMFLNGFAYESQRWSFAIALPIAYSLVSTWNELKENKKYLLIAIVGIMGLSYFSAWSRNERGFVPVIFVIVFYVIAHIEFKKEKIKDICMIAVIIINIFYIGQYHLSSRGKDVLSDLLSIEDAKNFSSLSEAYAIKQLTSNEKEFFRYTGNNQTNNASIMFDVNSTNYYFSMTNSNEQKFRMKMDIRDRFSIEYKGYDSRAELETLANVKYYVAKQGYNETIPYGFDLIKSDDKYSVYKNNYFVPFGYTYKNAISYAKWDEMSSLEKQEAMMQAIVLDDVADDSLDLSNITKLDYQIVCEDGIEVNDNKIIVKDENAKMTLLFEGKNDVENYILINNLNFIDTDNMIEDEHSNSRIRITASNGKSLNYMYLPYGHRYSFNKTDYTFYFGNTQEPISSYEITFSLIGTYTFNYIGVYNQTMDRYKEYVYNLSNEHLNNVTFDTNRISGEINLKQDKYVLLSVPYSKGWSAKIDGVETEVLRANEHYSAFKLDAGHHTIEMNYCTPGIKLGIVIEIIGFMLFGAIIYLDKKKKL